MFYVVNESYSVNGKHHFCVFMNHEASFQAFLRDLRYLFKQFPEGVTVKVNGEDIRFLNYDHFFNCLAIVPCRSDEFPVLWNKQVRHIGSDSAMHALLAKFDSLPRPAKPDQ